MDREDFMDIVYSELHSDVDNNRSNRIIDAADEYAESANATDKNVGTKISKKPLELARAISGLTEWQKHVQTDSNINRDITVAIEALKAQLGTNLAEVGTRAVRGYPIDADALMEKVAEEYGERARDTLYRIIRYMPPAQPDCAKCKSELANKIRGQQDNPGMLTENDKGRNWGLEWAAQIVEGKRR